MKRISALCSVAALILLLAAPDSRASVTCILGVCYGGEGEVSFFGQCDPGLVLSDGPVPVLSYCRSSCGGRNEWGCYTLTCDQGLTLNLLSRHCVDCGGHGEGICVNIANPTPVCDRWHTQVPPLVGPVCLSCGGQGEPMCLNLAYTGDLGCKAGHTINPNAFDAWGDSLEDILWNNLWNLQIGTCTACGGEGEYMCLNLVTRELGCKSGYTLDPDVINDPKNLFGRCTACGGDGEFQCLNFVTGDYACDENHTADPANPFLCMLCSEVNKMQSLSVMRNLMGGCDEPWQRGGTCDPAWELVGEPDCDVYDVGGNLSCLAEPQPDGPLFGVADTHGHLFSNLAFGGALLWGSPFDERGVNAALARCDYTWDFSTETAGTLLPIPTLPTENGYLIHKAPMAELMANLNEEGFLHSPDGPQSFDNWPSWDTTMHQQQYYRWLQRAYKGGLRLMVMLAVNNEVSCLLSMSTRTCFGCDDMAAVDRQLQATRDLEAFIDREHGGGGKGWFRIVTTPEMAREEIRKGNLAVVLGTEVDALFGCKNFGDCTDQYVREQVQHYYDKGVRHIFPMHLHDNAFGGSAIYYWLWPIANVVAIGKTMDLDDYCKEDNYNYAPNPFVDIVGTPPVEPVIRAVGEFLIEEVLGINLDFWPVLDRAVCNNRELKDLGYTLVDELMAKKMIIDADHMSLKTLNNVLSIAEGEGYPLISGHSFLFDKPLTERGRVGYRTEAHRTKEQIKRIRDLGGIVSPLSPRKAGSSTHDYVKMYNYVKPIMEENTPLGEDNPGIAFSSDWGAMFLQVGPRCPDYDQNFPPLKEYCGTFHEEQEEPLKYPFTINGMPGESAYTFEPSRIWPEKAGEPGVPDKTAIEIKIFDFNRDGMAHIGLFPDFFADLENVGLTVADLQPLYRSAETYIKMWERIENDDRDGDLVPNEADNCPAVSNTDQANCDGDELGDVCDPDFPCNEPPDCSGAYVAVQACNAACEAVISGTDVSGVTDPDGDPLVIQVSPPTLNLGLNTVSVTAEDGNGGACQEYIIVNVVDETPPAINCPADIAVGCDPGVCGAVVGYLEPQGTDNCPGAATDRIAGLGAGAFFPVGTVTETYTVTDAAGLGASCSMSVTVEDTEIPEITCPANIEFEPTSPAGANVTYPVPVGVDNCSGAATVLAGGLGSDSTFPIGITEETYLVTDAAGNAASCSFTVKVLSPEEVVRRLIGRTEALRDDGTLHGGQGKGLISKLSGVVTKLQAGPRLRPACNQLQAFINQVKGYVKAGKMSAAEGEDLTNSAVNAGYGAGCRRGF